jgi:hypothetical protein
MTRDLAVQYILDGGVDTVQGWLERLLGLCITYRAASSTRQCGTVRR